MRPARSGRSSACSTTASRMDDVRNAEVELRDRGPGRLQARRPELDGPDQPRPRGAGPPGDAASIIIPTASRCSSARCSRRSRIATSRAAGFTHKIGDVVRDLDAEARHVGQQGDDVDARRRPWTFGIARADAQSRGAGTAERRAAGEADDSTPSPISSTAKRSAATPPATASILPTSTTSSRAIPGRRRPRSTRRSRPRAPLSRPGREASPEVRSDLLDKVGTLIMARAKELGTPALARGGQDASRGHGRGDARRAHLQIFRRRGAAPPRPDARIRRGPAIDVADLSRGGRRFRPDHALEFPDRDSGLEERAGAGLRQHGGAEARQRRRRPSPTRWPRSSRRRRACRACSTW